MRRESVKELLNVIDDDKKKLLYLIFLLTESESYKELWIKDFCLKFVIYEAIKEGVFTEYDYAPAPIWWHGVYRYANVSQESMHDILYLLSMGLIIRLELATRYFDTIEAYRVSGEAARLIENVFDGSIKVPVKDFITCQCGTLYSIMCTTQAPYLSCKKCGGTRQSDFLEVEIIPYKAMPYFVEL